MFFDTHTLGDNFVLSVFSLISSSMQTYEKKYRVFAGNILLLCYKRLFIISVIVVKVYYYTQFACSMKRIGEQK